MPAIQQPMIKIHFEIENKGLILYYLVLWGHKSLLFE